MYIDCGDILGGGEDAEEGRAVARAVPAMSWYAVQAWRLFEPRHVPVSVTAIRSNVLGLVVSFWRRECLCAHS